MARFINPCLFMFGSCLFLVISIWMIPMINAKEDEEGNESPFTYESNGKDGPSKWGTLKPEWQICQTGKSQSPIDLVTKRVEVLPASEGLRRTYKPAPAVIKSRGHDVSVVWNGDAGGVIINNTEYKLAQCHWHTPSEHTVDGQKFSMELHMVHQNSQGKRAVVSMLYKQGKPDAFLASLIKKRKVIRKKGDVVRNDDVLGLGVGEEAVELGAMNPLDIKFKRKIAYYRYMGSLTTPPCTEGVLWTILKKVKSVSKDQIIALRNGVHDGFEENARPTQDWNGRSVNLFQTNSRT